METSRQISSVRIHIERVIGGIKNRFAILQGTLSLRLIKSLKEESEETDLTSADKILRVCAILYNLECLRGHFLPQGNFQMLTGMLSLLFLFTVKVKFSSIFPPHRTSSV